MDTNNEDRELSWDEAPIKDPDEGGFVLLPDGEYPFFIPICTKARHPGSQKLPPCDKAIVHLEIDGGVHGQITVKHYLFLHSKCIGLLAQFFKGIGHRKEGEDLIMNWDKVAGSHGIVKLGQRTYNNKIFQDVKGFVENPQVQVPAPGSASTQPQQQAVAPQKPVDLPGKFPF